MKGSCHPALAAVTGQDPIEFFCHSYWRQVCNCGHAAGGPAGMQEVSEADVDSLIRGGPDELELAAHRMSTDLFGLSAIPQVLSRLTVALCSVLTNQEPSDPAGLSSA